MKDIGYSLERDMIRLKHGCQKCGGTGKVKEILGPIKHTVGDKLAQIILTPGFEAGSDYCGGCESAPSASRIDIVAGKCGLFPKIKLCNTVRNLKGCGGTSDTWDYLRCQQCKDLEQAAKQMIPRAEVENLLMFVAPVVYNESHDKYQNGVKFVVSRIQELLKPKKEKG